MPEPLLLLTALRKRFGGVAATDGADLAVLPGELHALIGPNGAGKTTLVHQVSGALRPDGGTIRFAGRTVTREPMHRRVHAGLARSYQVTSVFKRFPALDNVALAVQARASPLARLWRPATANRAAFEEAAALLDQVGLPGRAATPAGALGHGEQRQLELAITLATRPKLMLLDEPLAGMGPEEGERMVALLQSLKPHLAILLVEHDMDAVFRLADRISTLVGGKVIATGTPAEIKAHPEVRRAYLGEEA